MRTGLLDALKATEQAMIELPNIQNFSLSPGYRAWYDHATASDDDNEVTAEVLESGIKEVEEHDSAVAGEPAIEPSTLGTAPVVSTDISHTTPISDPNTTTDIPSPTEPGLVVDSADPEVLVDLNSLAHELDELDPDAVIPAQADAVSGWDTLDDYWKMLPDGVKDTHVPGRVEVATRVVHSTKYSEAETMNKGAGEAGADVGSVGLSDEERVEEELMVKFGRAIMRPWGAYIDGRTYGADIPRPVVDNLVDSSATKLGTHNPLRDDIEVVLKDTEVNALMSGWGLKGTFVQLVRRSFAEGDEKEVAGGTSLKALWFMVECKEVLPTYYVALED